MIIDSLDNAAQYYHLHPHFEKAFEYVKQLDLSQLEAGKFEIEGKEIHAIVAEKDGVAPEAAKYEAHDRYIDIQVCPSVAETLGWKPRSACRDIKIPYNEEKDVTIFEVVPDTYFTLRPGQFALFYPGDVHGPMIGVGPIKKLVIKVKI